MDRAITPPGILEALRFSLSDTTGLSPQELTPMHQWLIQNPGSWRLSRTDLLSDERRRTSGSILVTGEAGCGKTTLMAEEADFFRTTPETFVAHINFMDAERIDEQTKDDDLIPRLGIFLTSQIEANIGEYDRRFKTRLWDAYQAGRAKELIQHEAGGYLSEVKRKFLSSIDDMTVDAILAEPSIAKALRDHQEQFQENLMGLRAIQRVEQPDKIVIILDNLDNIGGRHAARCLDSILRKGKTKALIYCALRNENEYAAAKLSTFMSERIYVSVPSLRKIVDIRTKGAGDYYKSKHLAIPRGLATVNQESVKAMTLLERDRNGFRILTKWHNYNIRNILTFVTSRRKQLSRARSGSELHGILLSSLIWNVDGDTDFLLEMLNPSDNSAKGLPFLFLKLRILSYLRKHGGQCPMKRLTGAFSKFGVERAEVEAALTRLGTPTLVVGAFTRTLRTGSGFDSVVLLPAGDLFLTEISYSVEFLGYQEEKRGGKQSFNPIARLNAASYFVGGRLLPAFRKEHPYVRPGRRPTFRDQERLRHYREDFGFVTDQWFVSGLARSLVGYAEVNDFVQRGTLNPVEGLSGEGSEAVRELLATVVAIRTMERSLNDLLDFDFESQ